ncbi:hypothetical protein [Kitasatospora griseola]|uniref:hypothetical protein n=1 Tax=Kitasatospora griseola TaxID=2064 RepID=UPI00380358AA
MTDPGRPVLRLPDTPGYPVARGVTLPEGHEYTPTGSLSLRLGDLKVTLDADLGGATVESLDDGHRKVTYALPPLVVSGRYSLDVTPEQPQLLDTAGDLRPLSDQLASPGTPVLELLADDVRDAYLDTAREQREKLVKESDKGYTLVSTFYEHNEIYNEAFQKDAVSGWQAGGATKEMARDTDAAVTGSGVVNSRSKLYDRGSEGPPLSFNAISFLHKLSVETAVVLLGDDGRGGVKPAYQKAVNASDGFGRSVIAQTGNEKDTIVPMTAPQVHEKVKGSQSDDEPPAVDPGPYLDPDSHLERIAGTGTTTPGGLDEADLRHIRSCRARFLGKQAAARSAKGAVLHQGPCGTRVTGATVTAETRPEAGRHVVAWVSADIPDLSLELDDSDWSGDVGRTARERIAAMGFVRTLLQDALAERVRIAVANAVPGLTHPDLTGAES